MSPGVAGHFLEMTCVALLNLRNAHVTMSNLRNSFVPCRYLFGLFCLLEFAGTLHFLILFIIFKISPIDELPDIMPRKRKTEVPRKLLMSPSESRNSDCTPDNDATPSKTNSEQLQPVNCRTDELDNTQQESSSQEQTARKGKTPATNTDHGYGKTKPQRRKKHNRVNPAAQELKTELECKSSAPVLTSKQQACFQLAVTGETSPENVASAVLSMPPLSDAIVDKLSEKLAKIPETMRNRKHGKVSVLMRKGYDDMRKTNLVEIVREFQQEFPDLFKFVLSVMKGSKPFTPSDIQTLIPRITMLYSIMLQTRVPDLSRLQRILTMALGEQICNQKVSVLSNTVRLSKTTVRQNSCYILVLAIL